MAKSSAWEDIRRVEMMRALGDLLRMRAMMAPIAVIVLPALFWSEPAIWRRVLLLGVLPIMLLVIVIEAVRARRGQLGAAAAGGNAAVMFAALLPTMAITGGIESPAAPALLIMIVLAGVLASARAARWLW